MFTRERRNALMLMNSCLLLYFLYLFGIHPTCHRSHLPGLLTVLLWIECRCGGQDGGKNESGFGMVYYLIFCFSSNSYSSVASVFISPFSCSKMLFLFYLLFLCNDLAFLLVSDALYELSVSSFPIALLKNSRRLRHFFH